MFCHIETGRESKMRQALLRKTPSLDKGMGIKGMGLGNLNNQR